MYEGNKVAVKTILCEELDLTIVHQFCKEALLSIHLKEHPNIVKFYGIALQPPELCLIYEYCKHKSLLNVLQNINIYTLNYQTVLSLALQIAKGISL